MLMQSLYTHNYPQSVYSRQEGFACISLWAAGFVLSRWQQWYVRLADTYLIWQTLVIRVSVQLALTFGQTYWFCSEIRAMVYLTRGCCCDIRAISDQGNEALSDQGNAAISDQLGECSYIWPGECGDGTGNGNGGDVVATSWDEGWVWWWERRRVEISPILVQ